MQKFKWQVQYPKSKPWQSVGLVIVLLMIGLPYLLAGLHIGPELLNDALLGQCPTRAYARRLPCNLPPYADTTLAGFGFFMTCAGLGGIFNGILSLIYPTETFGKFVGCIAYIGLMYAAIPVLFKANYKNAFDVVMASFILLMSIFVITVFSYNWFKQKSVFKK
jgi:hypothetical protein